MGGQKIVRVFVRVSGGIIFRAGACKKWFSGEKHRTPVLSLEVKTSSHCTNVHSVSKGYQSQLPPQGRCVCRATPGQIPTLMAPEETGFTSVQQLNAAVPGDSRVTLILKISAVIGG